MKNFPHQYNDFEKLRGTLVTVRDLNEAAEDVGDDGVLGYELTRRGINTLREAPDLPLEERIRIVQARRPSRQGPRTAARELRRTLRYLGWLDDNWDLTDEGSAFLNTSAGSEDERAAWQRALLDLALADPDDNVSHPVRILLRLVADHEIVERRGTELALEARDDTEGEYQRITALVELSDSDRLRTLETTAYQVANARKILPAFAKQANLIHRNSRSAPYTLTEAGRAALGEGFASRAVALRPAVRSTRTRRARGTPHRIRPGDVERPTAGTPEGWALLSHEEQIAATRLRFERTARHQDLVAELLELLDERGIELFEDASSYDLLRVPEADAAITILEVKTLEADDLTQTRLAVGQLLSYEHLNVRPRWEGRDIERAVVYERRVDEELATFLNSIEIGAFAVAEGALVPLNAVARASGLV